MVARIQHLPLWLIGVIVFLCNQLPAQSSANDLDVIASRLIQISLEELPENWEKSVREYIQSIQEDGSWADQDYSDTDRVHWKCGQHLQRLRLMAKAYRKESQPYYRDAQLREKIVKGLAFWIQKDPKNANWWHNEIGIPLNIGYIMLFVGPDVPRATTTAGIEIMKRTKWDGSGRKNLQPWTGQNLVWGTTIQIIRGCLESNSEIASPAFEAMWKEIQIANVGQEAIQADRSFHQHGPILYTGGYGAGFASDCAQFVVVADQTKFAAPKEKFDILMSYLLDGVQWMVRGKYFDYSCTGREITRKDKSASILNPAVDLLATISHPRQDELKRFVMRLKNEKPATAFEGNKHFWRSDYISHVRRDYSSSVRMSSTRTFKTDGLINGEGMKTHHLAEGLTYFLRKGDEYANIFPIWDWMRLPGTTLEQTEPVDPTTLKKRYGKSPFVGGVSNGRYGCAAMDLEVNALKANKSWFFFDKQLVCLGNNIECTNDTRVVTTINQCWLRSSVETPKELSSSSKNGQWIWHDSIAYVIPGNQKILLSSGTQNGSWSQIGSGSSDPISGEVFNLGLDHGKNVSGGHYEYIVLPDAPNNEEKEISTLINEVEVLSNTPSHQAVRNSKLNILGIVFRKAEPFDDKSWGPISVDHPCLILIQKSGPSLKVSACNPFNEPLKLNVEIFSKKIEFNLPEGAEAGKSITQEIKL
jgi:chondroitin AC lyase